MIYDVQFGILLGVVNILGWELFRYYRKFGSMEKAYWGERKGRTRVEQEMRRLAKIQLNTSEGFFVQPIGAIESCYKQCIGTPRQGALVPASRAIARLKTNMSPGKIASSVFIFHRLNIFDGETDLLNFQRLSMVSRHSVMCGSHSNST